MRDKPILARASLSCGIFSLGCCCAPVGIAAIVCGLIALNDIKRSPSQAGYYHALTEMVMGCCSSLIFLVFGTHAAIEVSGEPHNWKVASERNSVDAYDDFLRSFPNGKQADEARIRITQLRTESLTNWTAAKKVNTLVAYREYVRRFPNSDEAKEARVTIEQLEKEEKRKEESAEGRSTEEKRCGACLRMVSLRSHAGERCPHCGALWSYETKR